MDNKLNILIVGAGMYVCGRDMDSYGTVLPAIGQYQKETGLVGKVTICSTKAKNQKIVSEKTRSLESLLGVSLEHDFYPKGADTKTAYQDALSSGTRYDCALVVVPDHFHYEIAKTLLERGLHVLVVKPFTPQLSLAKELTDLAKKKNLYGFVEFHKRFDQANLILREEFLRGRIGKPLYVNVGYSQRKIVPEVLFSDWVRSTNIFQYLGVHYVDIIHFITQARPLKAMAVGQKSRLAEKGIDTYDAIEAVIEWETMKDKFVSVILVNWVDPNKTSAMSDQKIELIGTRGRMKSDQKDRGLEIVDDENGVEDRNPYFSQFYPDIDGKQKRFAGYGNESFRCFLSDVEDIKSGKVQAKDLEGLRPTFRSALVSTAVIEAVNKSLQQGSAWVGIDNDI